MAYIGNTQQNQNYVAAVDYFNGNGSTVAFTLSRPVASVAQVQAVVNNVPQNPGSAFTVSGNTITFTGAPSSGTNNIYVYYTSPNTQVIQPGQGTVGTTQLVDGSVTTAKILDANVTQAKLAANVAGNGPAFSAYANTGQTISSSVWTKVAIDTEEFDTSSCFNNTGSTVGSIPAYAFLPTVAGYYQVSGQATVSNTGTNAICAVYKNGNIYKRGSMNQTNSFSYGNALSALVYLNGTTDYIELYTIHNLGTNGTLGYGSSVCFFQASMVRAA